MFRREEKRKNKHSSAPSDSLLWLIAVSGMMTVLILLLWVLPGLGWYPALVLVDTLPPLLLALIALLVPMLWLLTLYLLLKQRWDRWLRFGAAMLLFAGTLLAVWMPFEQARYVGFIAFSPLDSIQVGDVRYTLAKSADFEIARPTLERHHLVLSQCDISYLDCSNEIIGVRSDLNINHWQLEFDPVDGKLFIMQDGEFVYARPLEP